jgi:hypothetical protein
MNRPPMKVKKISRRMGHDRVAALLRSVHRGEITGERFCAAVSDLDMADRTRLLAGLLRDYKDLNNFQATTGSKDKVAS